MKARTLLSSMARLTPFEVGQIKAHASHEISATEIASLVFKTDGSPVSVQGVCDVIKRLDEDPTWRGERTEGSGAPRKTTAALDRAIVREVFRMRGSTKVTVSYLKKRFPLLRPLSNTLVEERLADAGLRWLRRRKKSLVPKSHKKAWRGCLSSIILYNKSCFCN